MNRIACILLCCVALGSAAEVLDQQISINIWGDRPSETVLEINAHLPPHQRLAWYVDPALDESIDTGPVLELLDTSVRAVLDSYCEQTGLSWSGAGRAVWLWKATPADQIAAWQQQLASGTDDAARATGLNGLLAAANPAALEALLNTAASGDATAKSLVWRSLRQFLGLSPSTPPGSLEEAFALFGDPDRSKRRYAVLGECGEKLPANWAAIACVATVPRAKATIEQLVAASDQLSADLPRLFIGLTARLDATREALAAWKNPESTGHGGWTRSDSWMKRYVSSRPAQLEAWAWGDQQSGPDYAADAAKLREQTVGIPFDQVPDLQAQRKELSDQIDELKKDKKANAAKIKELEQERKGIEGRLKGIEKAVEDQHKVLDRFDGFGPEAAQVLHDIVVDTGTDPILRQKAAKALQRLRVESIIPGLIEVCRNDSEPRVRADVALTLGASRSRAAIAALKEDLQHPSSPVTRTNAIRGLILSGHPQAGDWVLDQLAKTSEIEERQKILQYLGFFRSQRVLDQLIGTATDQATPVVDRLSAVAALANSPTRRARDTLSALLADESQPILLRTLTIDAFTPKTIADVDRFQPMLIATARGTTDEELLKKVIEGLQHCGVLLSPADPRRTELAHIAIELLRGEGIPNNARQKALNIFSCATADAEVAQALGEILAAEKSPIMKQFIKKAQAHVAKSLAAP